MKNFCEKAIPYLKERLLLEKQGAGLTFSSVDANAPILKILECGVCVAYVVERDDGLVFVQNRHLIEDGFSVDELHDMAMGNLLTLANEELRIKNIGPILGVFLDGNFEASVMLLDRLWDIGIAHTVQNGFTIAIPARDILAYCDSKSEQGIAALRGMIERASGADHPVSKSLYERIDGKWHHVGAPNRNHPV